jgi:hypothetical protein
MKSQVERAIQLAHKVREAAERYQALHPKYFNRDLCGLCGIASMALMEYLRKHGIEARFIMGTVHEDMSRERVANPLEADHCWVEVPIDSQKNQVIDITMTQFKKCDKVYLETINVGGVASRSRGYASLRHWKSDRATPQTTNEILSLIR